VKLHVCNECGMKFVQAGDLTNHSRIYSDDNPYRHNLCEKAFNVGSKFCETGRNRFTQSGDISLISCIISERRITRRPRTMPGAYAPGKYQQIL